MATMSIDSLVNLAKLMTPPISKKAYEEAMEYRSKHGPMWAVTLEKLYLQMKESQEMTTADWIRPLQECEKELLLQIDMDENTIYLFSKKNRIHQLVEDESWSNTAGPIPTPKFAIEELIEDGSTLQFIHCSEFPFSMD